MSNRDPLYGKSDKSGADDLGFDSTLSDSSSDLGSSTFSDSDGVTFDATLSETADDRGSFGSSSEGSLYDSAAGSIKESDTTEQWGEFYDATTSDDSGNTGNMGDMKHKAQDTLGKATEKKDEVMDKASGMMGQASGMMDEGKHKAGEMAGMAQGKMDGGMNKAGETMDNAAQMLRDKGEQGGAMGTVAGTAANAMESAGSFLQETDTGEMMDQLEAYIRQNPTQALLIAAGVGFVLAKAFK